MSEGAPPTIPASLQIYNSYVEDPIWQARFTAVWCAFLGVAVVVALPSFVRALRNGRLFVGFFGVSESLDKRGYVPVIDDERKRRTTATGTTPTPPRRGTPPRRLRALLSSAPQWSLPYVALNLGQIVLLAGYLALALVCIVKDAPLVSNPNRAGFLAFAQLPIVFLFGTKNSLLSLLLGPGNGYEKLNFLHRMAGRVMFLAAAIHGALWIRNHLQYGLPILGPQKETSGVASLAVLGCIVLFSLRPVRRRFYQWFFVTHVLTFVAFFVCVCYHSVYAPPWIFPPLAFYGADMFMRMLRYRFKDATLTARDRFMTMVRVHDCDGGWVGGQHVCLRVFFEGRRVLESHPMTILCAPPRCSCLSDAGLTLGVRERGDWTKALNGFARAKRGGVADETTCEDPDPAAVQVQVMLDGPYGGSSVDLGEYETALLVAGGSGVTFTLGLLDDVLGRCVKLGRRGGERTRRIEFAWCVRELDNVRWFAGMLTEIAKTAAGSSGSVDLHISIFVTRAGGGRGDPAIAMAIPNCDVMMAATRPSMYELLQDVAVAVTSGGDHGSVEEGRLGRRSETGGGVGGGAGEKRGWGRVAVCASGPEGLTRDVQNAVARLGVARGVVGVAVHVEDFRL